MIARQLPVIPLTPLADHTGLEGSFILATGGIVTSATTAPLPLGVILEGFTTAQKDSVGLPNLGATVKVKLAATPGTVVFGSYLVLDGTTLGAVKLDPGSGARVQVARALEAGTANELIEAYLVDPVILA
ncbi:MAG: hypothetical protein DUW69_001558 [Verrucomicrobia bacterium]|nr:MAG: hypothetical protein DUW69_001558 [Verrucomicrobiota bacterium]